MRTTRKMMLLLLFSLGLTHAGETAAATRFYSEFDLYTGMKAGICHKITDRINLYAGAGIALASPTQFTYNLFASYAILDPGKRLHLDINAGLIHCVFDVLASRIFPTDNPAEELQDYFYVNPGIAAHVSYPLGGNLRIGFRAGVEVMTGYDMGAWRFDPEPEPNLALTLTF